MQSRSTLYVATSCTNLVRFGAVTMEKLLLIFCGVWKNCKNWHIRPFISEGAQLILTKFSALIDMLKWMINLMIVLKSFKGCCYGNQLILRAFLKLWNWPSSVVDLVFQNRMQENHLHKGINTGDDTATLF